MVLAPVSSLRCTWPGPYGWPSLCSPPSDKAFISKGYDATTHFETTVDDVLDMYRRITGKDLDLSAKDPSAVGTGMAGGRAGCRDFRVGEHGGCAVEGTDVILWDSSCITP